MAEGLIVFDIGGTLVQGPDVVPARRLAAELGLSDDVRKTISRAIMTRPFADAAEVAVFMREELNVFGAEPAVEALWLSQSEDARPVPGALAVLESLCEAGFRLAVLSNIWPPYLRSVLRHFGEFFDSNIEPELQRFSFRLGEEKPAPRVFAELLHDAGVPAERSVMVGDSYLSDLEPAATLGMRTLWTLHRPEKEIFAIVRILNRQADPPNATVASLNEVDPRLVASLLDPR